MKQSISIIISVSILVLGVMTMLFPSVQIDIKILALLAIAGLPWLAPSIKSIELPGGVKIEFHSQREKRRAKSNTAVDKTLYKN